MEIPVTLRKQTDSLKWRKQSLRSVELKGGFGQEGIGGGYAKPFSSTGNMLLDSLRAFPLSVNFYSIYMRVILIVNSSVRPCWELSAKISITLSFFVLRQLDQQGLFQKAALLLVPGLDFRRRSHREASTDQPHLVRQNLRKIQP